MALAFTTSTASCTASSAVVAVRVTTGKREASRASRVWLRLYSVTSHPLQCSIAASAAAAAPPAPSSAMRPRGSPSMVLRTSASKPPTSVLSPTIAPSRSIQNVFTAPTRSAIGDRRAHSATAASLCGIVMFPAALSSANSAST